jgi:membrane protein YqaA with SNARE-associated domain
MLVGLFFQSFLAATLFPVSSEVFFYAVLYFGEDPWKALLTASIGNCLGVALNYVIGRGIEKSATDHLNSDSRIHRCIAYLYQKFDRRILLLSWLPIIGDPITILAGVAKFPASRFFAVACSLRILRYVVLLLVFVYLR